MVAETDAACLLITKGAPEPILRLCEAYEVDGTRRDLDTAACGGCQTTYETLSAQGYRVLAVACRDVPRQAVYTASDEQHLVLVGFVTFIDPPVPGITEVLHALHQDGVTVKILTGDNERVAQHICAQVGLDGGRVVLGEELETMSDPALAAMAERTTVFARMSPAQKHRVLFLPFLPMLPTQILLNNFLYDLAQITIPTDRVDTNFVQRP